MAFLFAFSTQTFAIDYTVNRNTDEHDAALIDGICDINFATAESECTLRAAIEQANNFGSDDRILFNLPANSIITLTTANGGEIAINNNGILEIVGTGANNLTIDGGAGANSIFLVNSALVNSATVTIRGVTLSGGNGTGAAVFAIGGTLILEEVVVQNNAGDGSTLGAVLFTDGMNHRIANSTFLGNTGFGGCAAIYALSTSLTVVNTTVSGNSTTASGNGTGAICIIISTATFRNTTISGNTAGGTRFGGGGGGIYILNNATVNLGNTIVAGNTTPGPGPDLFRADSGSTFTTSGGNLIGDNSGNPIEPNTDTFPTGNPNANGDKVGTGFSVINPLLGPLQNNGGPTPTRALLSGSPAIDSGVNTLATAAGLTTDQRGAGFLRIRDGNSDGTPTVDIGAFEVQLGTTAATVSVSGRVTTAQGRGIRNVVVTMTDSSGNTRTATTTSFGYYRFEEVEAGETYVFSARGKRFSFGQNSQVHSIMEDTNNINFVAAEQSVFSVN